MMQQTILTRHDVEVRKNEGEQWGWYNKHTNEYITGLHKGVNKRLFAYKPPTPEQAARMKKGVDKHAEIEAGTAKHSGLAEWLSKRASAEAYKEVFVYGDLFGYKTIGFIDYLDCFEAEGSWQITDFKFTGMTKSACDNFADSKYAPVQICYAKLFYDTYGMKAEQCNILNLFEDQTFYELSYTREKFGQYYTFAKALNQALNAR